MCGIGGEVCWNENAKNKQDIYEKMLETLKRRGCGQTGVYANEAAALVHSRECDKDTQNGKQPMIYQNGSQKFVMVSNGAIYNSAEIKQKLTKLGFKIMDDSDAELFLLSYVAWGTKCVNEFNGVFAFAVWEEHNKKLFAARDRIGVKPLFYAAVGNSIVFGSEIKTLLAHPKIKPVIDIDGISEIMLLGPGRTAGCGVFCGVKELENGHYMVFNKNGLKVQKYWDLTEKSHTDNFEQTAEKVRFLVNDAIARQLDTNAEVCTLLSGGLDSSIISVIVNDQLKAKGKTLHTFSLDYVDNDKHFKISRFQPNSDGEYIKFMNNHLSSINHRIVLSPQDLADSIYEGVETRDLPGMGDIDTSLLLFCREIKKTSDVVFSGECSDEIFAGYPWYYNEDLRDKKNFPWSLSTTQRLPFVNKNIIDKISPNHIEQKYEDFIKSLNISEKNKVNRRIKELYHLHFKWFMQTLVDRKDRMTAHTGLDAKVPYCDYRIAEYLYNVPWEFKFHNNYEKGLLREAMNGYLPEKILWRKKSPFPKTHNPNYQKLVSEKLKTVIENKNSPLLQIANKTELESLLNSNNETPWYGQLMTTPQTIAYFLQVNYWLEKYNIVVNI